MNCNDCLHKEVCVGYEVTMPECEHFADKSLYIKLPCKVGDTVYVLGHKHLSEIEQVYINQDGVHFEYVEYERSYDLTEIWDDGDFEIDEIGKTVFLSLEEAEAALKEREK